MSDYKLVPLEPTYEMALAAMNAETQANYKYGEPADFLSIWRAMLAAAPAVQGEPVGWYTEDHLDDKSATTYNAEVAQRWRAKGWPVTPLYTAPQPAEQQPALTKYQPCGCVICTCEHETQCQGCGAKHCGTHPVGQIPGPVYQQPTPDVTQLVEALTMARETIVYALRANAPDYFTTDADIAWYAVIQRIDAALAAYRKGGEK